MLVTSPRKDTLAFQLDLWSARGDFPRILLEVRFFTFDLARDGRE